MNTTVQSLQQTYVKLGGNLTDTYTDIADGAPVSDYQTIPDVLSAINEMVASGGGGGYTPPAGGIPMSDLADDVQSILKNSSYYGAMIDDMMGGAPSEYAESISAHFTRAYWWLHAGDDIDKIRKFLTVEVTDKSGQSFYTNGYALAGELTEGVSTIEVLYGALSTTVDVEVVGDLPAGYTRFDYIEAIRQSNPAEEQRILTKKYPNLYDYSLKLIFGHTFGTPIGEASDKTFGFPLGGRASSDWTKEAFNVKVSTTGVAMTTHGSESAEHKVALKANTKHRLDYHNTNSSPSYFWVDGAAGGAIAWSTTGAANVALAVCSRQKEGETATLSGGVQCGEFELTALDGSVVGHYIPCVKKDGNDFIIGLYEIVEGVFYTSEDTTRATIDNDNCLYFVGNWAEDAERGVDYTSFTRSVYAACPMSNMQGFDIADGDIFIRRSNQNGTMSVVSGEFDIQISNYACTTGHGNSASFRNVNGEVKFSEQDKYPLLIVCGDDENAPEQGTSYEDAGDTVLKSNYELRVTTTGYTPIRVYKWRDNVAGFYAGLSIDEATKIGYSVGTTIRATYDVNSKTIVCKWNMDELTENEDGSFTPTLISAVEGPHVDVLQGQQYHGGLLYVADGPLNSSGKIHVIDPDTGTKIHTIDTGVVKELEGLAWIGNWEVVVGYVGGVFEKFTFADAAV